MKKTNTIGTENSKFQFEEISIVDFMERWMSHIPTRVTWNGNNKEMVLFDRSIPLPSDYDISDESTKEKEVRRDAFYKWAEQFQKDHVIMNEKGDSLRYNFLGEENKMTIATNLRDFGQMFTFKKLAKRAEA